jgi:nicotinamidase-related amidase
LQIVDEILSERGFEQVDICGQSLEIADETGETVLSIDL